MTKSSEISNVESKYSSSLKKDLKKLRTNILFVPIFFSILFLIVKITDAFNWESGIWSIIGMWTGIILLISFFELKPKYIYGFSINEERIIIDVVNILGTKANVILPTNKIEKVKYRKKNSYRHLDKIWIHLNDSIVELYFITDGLGNGLITRLKVEKI